MIMFVFLIMLCWICTVSFMCSIVFGNSGKRNLAITLFIAFLISGVGSYLGFTEYGYDHMTYENIIGASQKNMHDAWPYASSIDVINDMQTIGEHGVDKHLDSNIDHVIGYDIVKKNKKDAVLRLDYIERVRNKNQKDDVYVRHNDLVLASNHDVKEIHNNLWLSDIDTNHIPDLHGDTVQENDRLRSVVNGK